MIFKWVIQKLMYSIKNKYSLTSIRASGWVPSGFVIKFVCCLTRQQLSIIAFFYFWASCFQDKSGCDPTEVLQQQHQLKQPWSSPLSSRSVLPLHCPFFHWGINLAKDSHLSWVFSKISSPVLDHCQLHTHLCHHNAGTTVSSQELRASKLCCYKALKHCHSNTSTDHSTREKMELLKRDIRHNSNI